jgi:hypothetical protein
VAVGVEDRTDDRSGSGEAVDADEVPAADQAADQPGVEGPGGQHTTRDTSRSRDHRGRQTVAFNENHPNACYLGNPASPVVPSPPDRT